MARTLKVYNRVTAYIIINIVQYLRVLYTLLCKLFNKIYQNGRLIILCNIIGPKLFILNNRENKFISYIVYFCRVYSDKMEKNRIYQ